MAHWRRYFGRSWLRATLVAAALAFVSGQILIAGHAAKYGDEPHEHGGAACVLSLAAPGAKFIAAAAFAFVVVVAQWRAADQIAQTELARIAVRAAHPRGPPHR